MAAPRERTTRPWLHMGDELRPHEQLTDEQWWAFDTLGLLCIPAADQPLPPSPPDDTESTGSEGTAGSASAALYSRANDLLEGSLLASEDDPAANANASQLLQRSPAIDGLVTQLCGGEPGIDSAAQTFAVGVQGGNASREPARRRDRTFTYGEGRILGAQRLVVLWALEDTDTVELVVGSHRAEIPPPISVLDGSDSSWFETQQLKRGDLLLVAGATLRRFNPGAADSLVAVEFTSGHAPPPVISLGEHDMPEWVKELDPIKQALLWPYRKQGSPGAEATPPVVLSDGEHTWFEHDEGHPSVHPALLQPPADLSSSLVNHDEMYLLRTMQLCQHPSIYRCV